MVRRLILWRLAAEERRLGVSIDYVRHILRTSLGAFFRFARIFPIAAYRRTLPADAANVARIVAARDEDCGTCVQIAVNVARAEGAPREVVGAVLDRAPERLPEGLADVYRFAEAVVTASGAEGPLRDRLRAAYGEPALVELALAIASARFFPIVKRSLGYAMSCERVKIVL